MRTVVRPLMATLFILVVVSHAGAQSSHRPHSRAASFSF